MIELFLLIAAPNFDQPHTPDAIPSAIRGSWDLSANACRDQYSSSRVHIGANWIGFYESSGVLQISTSAGIPDFDKSMAFRFAMAGEGSTWDDEYVFGWSKDQPIKLTWVESKNKETFSRDRERQNYVRCPK